MSTKSNRPGWMPKPGWSQLPRDDAEKQKQDNAADDARRKGASIGPSGDAVVQINDLGDGRFSTKLTHDGSGPEETEHGSVESVIASTRSHLMERQRAAKRKTMTAVSSEQDAMGNDSGDSTTYANM